MYVVVELTGGCPNSATVFNEQLPAVGFALVLLGEQDDFTDTEVQASREQLLSLGSVDHGDYQVAVLLAEEPPSTE